MALPNWLKTTLQMLLACLIPNIGGGLGALLVKTDEESWYGQLEKPPFNPPTWLFLPAWTYLYITQGYASYRVWKVGNGYKGEAQIPLIIFALQLLLNWIWTPIFFGFEALLAGLVVIVIIWALVNVTSIVFFRVDKIAGLLIVPYVGWLTFASLVNLELWRLNK